MSILSERIKQRREELGFSQEELAKKLGYKSRSTIAKIEGEDNDIPQSKIKAFADALETTPSWLMGWDENERMQYLRENRDTVIIQRLLGFRGCKFESHLSEKENKIVSYTVKHDEFLFDITADEFNELINNIKSYVDFKIHELLEINKRKVPAEHPNMEI